MWQEKEMGSKPGRDRERSPYARGLPVILLLIFPSILALAGSSATADSREDLPIALSPIPHLEEDQAHTFSVEVEGMGQVNISTIHFYWEFNDPNANNTNPSQLNGKGLTDVVHIYTHSGSYEIMVIAEDQDFRTGVFETQVYVKNLPPEPSYVAFRESSFEDEDIVLDASTSTDTPTDMTYSFQYRWILPDGSDIGFSLDPTVKFKLTKSGDHTIELQVKDNDGAIGILKDTIQVDNQPPLAFAKSQNEALEDTDVDFDASQSRDTDSDMDTLSYTWLFDDGATAKGMYVNHTFTTSGEHEAKLVVTDNDGMFGFASVNVKVRNVKPIANAGPDQNTPAGWVTLDGTNSIDTTSDWPLLEYLWDFGDGTKGTGGVVQHMYPKTGTYKVTLRVTDDDGETDVDSAFITVTGDSPEIDAGRDRVVTEDEIVEFSAVITGDEKIVHFSWDFGDGAMLAGQNVNHSWPMAGTYTVKLRVKNNAGAEMTDTVKVTVRNIAPVPGIIGPAIGLPDVDLIFDASATLDTPSDLKTMKYTWEFPDGKISRGERVVHRFTETGYFEIMLTAVDDDGNSGKDTFLVSIVDQEVLARDGLLLMNIDLAPSSVLPGGKTLLKGDVTFNLPGPSTLVDLLVSTRTEIQVTMEKTGRVWYLEPDGNGHFEIEITAPEKDGNYEISVQATLKPLNVIKEKTLKVQSETRGVSTAALAMQIAGGAALLCAMGAGIYIGGTDIGKFKFFALLIPLYSRVRKEKVLDHFERGRIYEHIRKTPGDHYTSIKRALGLKNGALAYHLRVLEQNEYIVSKEDGFYKRFYPYGTKIKKGKHKRIQIIIMELIMENPEITQKRIAEELGIDRSTVNYHIKILLAMGVIRSEKRGKIKVYFYEGVKDPLPYKG
jgi:PKD repeat protein/DNA-binding MarR family transcriptional regulator